MLADMHTQVEAARTLMWQAAWKVSQGQDALAENLDGQALLVVKPMPMVASMGMQIFGAYGYSMEFPMQRQLPRDYTQRDHCRPGRHKCCAI